MKNRVHAILRIFCCTVIYLLALLGDRTTTHAQQAFDLKPADSPLDNPLKGLVPYARPYPDRFPHSMEFSYLALSDLMLAEDAFDWRPLEKLLDDIASRGNQAVVRIYVEYPGKKRGIPKYLIKGGLKLHTYLNTNTAPLPPKQITTPDYEDEQLRSAFRAFIAAFGDKYDGDARLAYITAGLLGTWGEWHTYPRSDLWASKGTQGIVLDAYEAAFPSTPVLLRYPAGPDHGYQTENASRPFGYHDDSFAWATIDTGKQEDDWFYMPALKAAGGAAINKWKSHPIGGEIRPEAWGKIFDAPDQWPKQAQSFRDCVSQTHATWLMDTGLFREVASPQRLERATREVRRMGYDFFVRRAAFFPDERTGRCKINLQLINQGVAPFYADWPTEVALVDEAGKIAKRRLVPGLSMRGHLPSATAHELSASIDTAGLSGTYSVLMRVVHPLQGGKPLRFANAEQGQTKPGWLTLGKIRLR
ncbi:hypothetical protein Enr13x_18660 [Stieleria neptunia]|uniref:DUF4832 domain-containing protein n=1 Tax=Stieleria neptunia TaxID=2527979 RepID=A0A518HME2_9BACT|nr:DUF4832 domain-containing protein [Stieleria neptunia]QDV42023.1 hypothetical protein Enr13x_18660 [Stieleria neptunia]